MAVEPGLDSVYLGLRPVPRSSARGSTGRGNRQVLGGEVGIMGEGLDALPGGALEALVMLAECFL